jgi:hypothetical protein
MSSVPVTEETISAAVRRLPAERLPQVLEFIDSLQTPAAESDPRGKCWTATELRMLAPAERDLILAHQAASFEDEYRNNPELTDFEAFGDEDLYVEDSGAATR